MSDQHEPDELSRTDFDSDDQLRALVRSGDPARSLSPADPAALASLVEDIMSADLDLRPTAPDQGDEGSRQTGTHGRNRLTWLVAAAAAAIIAGVGGFAIAGMSDDSPPPQASDHRTSPPATGTEHSAPLAGQTTDLTASAPKGRCATVQPGILAQYDQAFMGTVTAIEGDTVTLDATDVYTGQVGETVQVTAAHAGFRALIQNVKFKVGGTYLVSASQGSVSMCGFSGQATDDLRSVYSEAFGR